MSLVEQLRNDSLTMVCASCCYVALAFAVMCLLLLCGTGICRYVPLAAMWPWHLPLCVYIVAVFGFIEFYYCYCFCLFRLTFYFIFKSHIDKAGGIVDHTRMSDPYNYVFCCWFIDR